MNRVTKSSLIILYATWYRLYYSESSWNRNRRRKTEKPKMKIKATSERKPVEKQASLFSKRILTGVRSRYFFTCFTTLSISLAFVWRVLHIMCLCDVLLKNLGWKTTQLPQKPAEPFTRTFVALPFNNLSIRFRFGGKGVSPKFIVLFFSSPVRPSCMQKKCYLFHATHKWCTIIGRCKS